MLCRYVRSFVLCKTVLQKDSALKLKELFSKHFLKKSLFRQRVFFCTETFASKDFLAKSTSGRVVSKRETLRGSLSLVGRTNLLFSRVELLWIIRAKLTLREVRSSRKCESFGNAAVIVVE